VARLGWINCDRFWDNETEKTDLVVTITDRNDACAYITFKDFKSIMEGTRTNGTFVFRNVPIGTKVNLIGVSYKDGKPSLAKIPLTITKQPMSLSGFSELSVDALEKRLNEL